MRTPTIIASIAVLGCATTVAQAGPAADTEAAPPASAAMALQERRVVRDKETGRLRAPTDDELKAMNGGRAKARTAAPQPVQVQRHASGMRSAVPGPARLVTLRAERQPDGSLAVRHDDPAHEHGFGRAPAQRPTE